MSMLKKWINDEFLSEGIIKEYYDKYISAKNFEHVFIDGLFRKNKLLLLYDELEKYEYYRESTDLYEFFRTEDFKKTKSNIVKEFRNFLKSQEFTNYISKICGQNIKKDIIDVHSLKLVKTNYLLCHDDRIEDRKIAFILNFSDFEEKDGGLLELFNVDLENRPKNVFDKIVPKFNRFIIFKVSEKSFHQISEVKSLKQRITIGGWLY